MSADSLIDNVEFSDSSTEIIDLLNECKSDFDSGNESMFIGISISQLPEGYSIKARHSGLNKEQLMIALNGAIDLFFKDHKED